MSILGRSGIGFISRNVGLVRLYKWSVLMMAASYLLWLPFSGYGWLIAFAATLGFGYGVRIALTPVVLIEFFGLGNLGTTLGVFFTASCISAVCGPLAAGLIIDWDRKLSMECCIRAGYGSSGLHRGRTTTARTFCRRFGVLIVARRSGWAAVLLHAGMRAGARTPTDAGFRRSSVASYRSPVPGAMQRDAPSCGSSRG
jgi:MFS family permease